MANNKLRPEVDRLSKFVDIAEADLRKLKDDLVFVNGDECYAFGKYKIVTTDTVQVWEKNEYQGTFSSSRSAMAWCTASKFRCFQLAALIKQFDERLKMAQQAVETRKYRAKKADFVHTAKLQQRLSEQFKAQHELEKYVSKAKYLQLRGFNNDTQRNSRTKT
jgi:hypothetical protein